MSHKIILPEGLELFPIPDLTQNGVYHFKAEVKSNNLEGWATDRDVHLGLQKAVSEVAERFVVQTFGPRFHFNNTNGIAAHVELPAAIENSRIELSERHVFMLNWIKGVPPVWLSEKEIFDVNFQKYIAPQGFAWKIGACGIQDDLIVLTGIVHGARDNIGKIVVSAAAKSLEKCVEKIFLDLIRATTILESERAKIKDIQKIKVENLKLPSDHIHFYLDPVNSNALKWYERSSKDISKFEPFVDLRYEIFEVKIGKEKRFVSRAIDPKAQQYFTGATVVENLNLNCFSELELKLINTLPHPLG